jgi:hypothetical protein
MANKLPFRANVVVDAQRINALPDGARRQKA